MHDRDDSHKLGALPLTFVNARRNKTPQPVTASLCAMLTASHYGDRMRQLLWTVGKTAFHDSTNLAVDLYHGAKIKK